MLNIAGPEYDFAQVLFAVLNECEHRRRSIDAKAVDHELHAIAREKLATIKGAYDEFGGSVQYWHDLEREVLDTAMRQYIPAAAQMNVMERNGFGVFRRGDPMSRFVFALCGLFIGSIIIALPFIPIFEDMFAFALTASGFFYPDIVRYTYERRHVQLLNRLVADAARYQSTAKLHYMTTQQIRESFSPPPTHALPEADEQQH